MPILILEHAGQRRTIPLAGRVWIGREEGCEVVINHPVVSRRHAYVDPCTSAAGGSGAVVTDNHSRNGVLIAGQRLDAPLLLREGDTFKVGPAMFAFHSTAADHAPPSAVAAPSVDAAEVAGIVFACACGARLWAPRGFGGSSTACPHCGRKVRCPGGDTHDEPSAAPPPPPATAIVTLQPEPRAPPGPPTPAETSRPRAAMKLDVDEDKLPPASYRPVELPLLLCAVIASAAGLIAYGLPAVAVLSVSAGFLMVREGRRRRVILSLAALISLAGMVAGVLASLQRWMGLSPGDLIGH